MGAKYIITNKARLLGSYVDPALSMHTNVDKIVGKARPEVHAIVRCIYYFPRDDLIQQYKTHVLCHLELNSGAFFHATDTVLEPIDRVQQHFLRAIGLTDSLTFIDYNLCPLRLRRDIAMLGFIYKAVHGLGHETSQSLFTRQRRRSRICPHTRLSMYRHALQLVEPMCTHSPALFARSIFGLVPIWNLLPQHAVSAPTVSCVQSRLTAVARDRCISQFDIWHQLYSARRVHSVYTDFI